MELVYLAAVDELNSTSKIYYFKVQKDTVKKILIVNQKFCLAIECIGFDVMACRELVTVSGCPLVDMLEKTDRVQFLLHYCLDSE